MSLWGHLHERYAEKRPRKILALDGGGIRGVRRRESATAVRQHVAEVALVHRLEGDVL